MGLDLSAVNTGVTILTEAGGLPLRHLTLEHPLTRKKKIDPPISEEDQIARMLNLANEIIGLVKGFKIEHIAIEGPAYAKPNSAHLIGQICGAVKTQLWLAVRKVANIVPPLTGRKTVFGFGVRDKKLVVEMVRELGVECRTDHEADSWVTARHEFMRVAKKA